MFKKVPNWHEMDKSTISLTTLVEEYISTCRLEGKSPKTIRGYREKLLRFVRSIDGTLNDFNLPTIRNYIATVQATNKYKGHPYKRVYDEPVSMMTVRNHVRILTAFAAWLEREEYTEGNVLAKLRAPKAPKKIMQTLTPEEISRILVYLNPNTATGCRNAAIVCLLLDTGLRCGELLGLKLVDLHLDDGWLKVMCKGQKERIVPFGNRCARLLQRYVNHFRPKNNSTDIVFLSIMGEPMTEPSIDSLFRRIAAKANIPRLHIHLCRHTFATNYLIGGGDSLTLQRILGHETLEMTRRYVDQVACQVTVLKYRNSPMDKINLTKVGVARVKNVGKEEVRNGTIRIGS
jgi:integrase/recombinase XerC/integrase/recombinase XerD